VIISLLLFVIKIKFFLREFMPIRVISALEVIVLANSITLFVIMSEI